MTTKYTPYNFIPFGELADHKPIAATKKALQQSHISHDKFTGYSGKIHCQIQSITPIVNGSDTIEKKETINGEDITYSEIKPYLRDKEPAIAANSLRGMISANIEALSLSGPRVLENKPFTFRQKAASRIYAYGAIVRSAANANDLCIQPLGLPPYPLKNSDENRRKWDKVFVDDQGRTMTLEQVTPIILPKDTKNNASTMKDDGVSWHEQSLIKVSRNNTLKGKLNTKGKIDKAGTLSIIRNLDVESQFSKNVQKVAFPASNIKAAKLPLCTVVINEYLTLLNSSDRLKTAKQKIKKANGRHEASQYAFTGEKVVGKIVLFDVKDGKVTLLADAQIWREKTEDTMYDFFKPNQLPFNAKRTHLSVAETLLGTVSEEQNIDQDNKDKISAYASRIRFYDAKVSEPPQGYDEELYQLPRLDSPKLPCPSMYFNVGSDSRKQFINKSGLNANRHNINGRKVYLRHTADNVQLIKKDRLNKQHQDAVFTPLIQQNTTLCFDIEFNNLNADELELLLTAIEPDADYKHQIGMAKPYGYGQIKLDIKTISLIDNAKQYQSFDDTNATLQWMTADPDSDLSCEQHWSKWLKWLKKLKYLSAANPLIDAKTLGFIQKIGNPANYSDHDIGYPTNSEDADPSIFGWFVNNDHSKQKYKQTLPRIEDGHYGLLTTNKAPPKHR
jgi:CRISPR-associated protein (TIGR03986 family)